MLPAGSTPRSCPVTLGRQRHATKRVLLADRGGFSVKITRSLAGVPCSNGVSCDRILATDGDDIVVQGRFLTSDEAAGLGLDVPRHEGLLLINRSLIDELRAG